MTITFKIKRKNCTLPTDMLRCRLNGRNSQFSWANQIGIHFSFNTVNTFVFYEDFRDARMTTYLLFHSKHQTSFDVPFLIIRWMSWVKSVSQEIEMKFYYILRFMYLSSQSSRNHTLFSFKIIILYSNYDFCPIRNWWCPNWTRHWQEDNDGYVPINSQHFKPSEFRNINNQSKAN